MKIQYTNEMLEELREKVKSYLTGKRLAHTLAVEEEIARLARIYLPEEENRLRAAALLHDVTKKLDLQEHLKICREFGIMIGEFPDREYKLFHSKTAIPVIRRDFDGFYDDEILSGVRWHTTGRAGMTTFESLVYLADYIEATRTFPDCVRLRSYFWGELESGADKTEVLRCAMVMSFDMTIACLIEEGGLIDLDTVSARNSFVLGIYPQTED